MTMKALLSHENIKSLVRSTKRVQCCKALLGNYADDEIEGKPMHDVNTLFYLAHPEYFELTDYWVDVVTEGPAMGGTIADILRTSHDGQTNVSVATDIDVAAFNEWFMAEIARIK